MRIQNQIIFSSQIKDITLFHKQGYYTTEKYNDKNNYYLFSGSNFINHVLNFNNCNKINASKKDYEAFKIKKGDILLVRSGNVGDYAIVESDVENAIFGSYLIKFNVDNSKVLNKYFCYFYESKSFKKQLNKIIQTSANTNINADNIKSVNISYPTLSEQQKVINILSLIDEKISTQRKILEDLNSLKKRIRNIIFSHEHKEYAPLKSYYIKGKAGGTPKTTKREYYKGNIPFLSISDISNNGKYIYKCNKNISKDGLNNSAAWTVPTGSLILSMYASVGYPCINKIELTTSQAMFSMILKKNINIDFLYEYLLYYKDNKLDAYLEKGTQSNINSNIVENLPIPLFEESFINKIVNVLNTLSEKIDNEEKILKLYQKQKDYLLNKMFI